MIKFKHHGDFGRIERFLVRAKNKDPRIMLERYALEGVQALSSATPQDEGLTANSWNYEIEIKNGQYKIFWTNTNIVDGIPVAILIQYGHATRSGTFIEGRDFINKAIQPIFDKIAENLWKEVTNL